MEGKKGNINGKSGNGGSSEDTKTEKSGGTRPEPRPEPRPETEGINVDENNSVGVVDIESLEDVPKPKKRGRPAGWRKDESKKVEEKKVEGLSANDVTPILQGLFGLVSLKAGEHWNISNQEAEQVAKPLCNILVKLNLSEKVSNISDGTALVIALLTIVAPRVILTASAKKVEKKVVEGVSEDEKIRQFKKNSTRDNGAIRGQDSFRDGSFIKELSNTTSGMY
jgi:hypothetical protein